LKRKGGGREGSIANVAREREREWVGVKSEEGGRSVKRN